jgi:hypothetical protein
MKTRFDKLKAGSWFIYLDELYIKVRLWNKRQSENSCRLSDGELFWFVPECQVIKVIRR